MAAYAALVSVMNTVEHITNHPRLSTSFHEKQIQSLREKADFLLDFIENYTSHGETRDLESQIASAACSAEDAIESHVVDQIHNRFSGSSSFCLLNLEKVMEEMDDLMEKAAKVKEERGSKNMELRYSISTTPASSKTAKTTMVGFDEELIRLMDLLTGRESSRRIISIEGMGGIGKTTLTRHAFENQLIVEHFYIRGWVTVSQNYSVTEILLQLLSCREIKETLKGYDEEMDKKGEGELGLKLYQSLSGTRYLIVLDDIWSVECWDKLKFFFPDYDNGSRVVVTTRLSNVATEFCSSSFKMNFLDVDKSWDLLCRTAFPGEVCPLTLEEISKEIAKKCKGLPLSIAVIGAFLGRSSRSKEYWENVAREINLVLKLDENEFCLNLLSFSYSHLPTRLKPCFLYMGIMQEDKEIRASQLIKLFVAEGFLKPNENQSLEEIAQGYLKDLVDRNLILVSRSRWNGTAKSYKIHDLLREVCLREVEKEKFLHYIPLDADLKPYRRIVFRSSTSDHHGLFDAFLSPELVRSLLLNGGPFPSKFRLLKVLNNVDSGPLEPLFEHVNLRYLLYKSSGSSRVMLPSSASLLWNLQTLIVRGKYKQIVVAPAEIWNMVQLRHLEFDKVCLPYPPWGEECLLLNLQTLVNVVNFNFSEEVCKRIPNVEKLHMTYNDFSGNIELGSLHKLQSLRCCVGKQLGLSTSITFPSSIKKLSLIGLLGWDEVNAVSRMLPHLEVLKLKSVKGSEWKAEEGAFPRLKCLSISYSDLANWSADDSHFPVLEKLHLWGLPKLDGIGEIPTLRCINMWGCSVAAAVSSAKILEEQLSLGNEDIEVRVVFLYPGEETSFREMVEVGHFPKKILSCESVESHIRAQVSSLAARWSGSWSAINYS